MSLGTILLIILVIALLGGFSGLGAAPSTEPAITAAADSASYSLSSMRWLHAVLGLRAAINSSGDHS